MSHSEKLFFFSGWLSDLVLACHDDVLRHRGGCIRPDLQRVGLRSRVAVGGEEAVVLLLAHRGSG